MKLAAANGITLQKINVKDPERLLFDGNYLSSLQDTDLFLAWEFAFGGL
jgi:hypothetical protein